SVEDTPTTFPTPNGGCHPLWVGGHLAYVEGMAHQLLGIGANPVADWAKFFEQGTTPIADATQYPPLEDVHARYTQLREPRRPLHKAQEAHAAANRVAHRSRLGHADQIPACRPRRTLRDLWENAADAGSAPDEPSQPHHGCGARSGKIERSDGSTSGYRAVRL